MTHKREVRRARMPWVLAACLGVLLAASPAFAQLDQLLKGLGGSRPGGLSDARIGAGLKETLEVSTDNAVTSTGRLDGYFANQAIKILMPEKLRTVEKGLRAVGYGAQVDELVVSMNRAAERAGLRPGALHVGLGCGGRFQARDRTRSAKREGPSVVRQQLPVAARALR